MFDIGDTIRLTVGIFRSAWALVVLAWEVLMLPFRIYAGWKDGQDEAAAAARGEPYEPDRRGPLRRAAADAGGGVWALVSRAWRRRGKAQQGTTTGREGAPQRTGEDVD